MGCTDRLDQAGAGAVSHGLFRLPAPDPRDGGFPLRALIPSVTPVRVSRMYSGGPILDQGDTSECVAFAWKQWLDSAPIKDLQAQPPDPLAIYSSAQALDEWAGAPHDGTSVRAGAKVIQNLHRLGSYRWSTSADDVRLYLLTTGTVVFGTSWYSGMWETSPGGFLKVSGSVVGGHAFLCVGYSQLRGAFRFCNSWGRAWGDHGRFWLSGEDVQRLLDEQGEACAGVEVRV
jgi:hypothetical protein